MISTITIALDAMGGDHAPRVVVEGASLALAKDDRLKFQFFGDSEKIAPLMQEFSDLMEKSEIIHTDQVVSPSAKPSQALRRAQGSSMGLAISAVKEKQAHALVSGGNTGALMALSMLKLRTIPGIDRPAICTVLPSLNGLTSMLDLGANVGCSDENLVQFAIMGAAFARTTLHLDRPKVALLNIGIEEMKGNEVVRAAARRLRETILPMDFTGYVEGDAIMEGRVDVIVTDGFTGNVALKTAEGTAKLITSKIGDVLRNSIFSRLGAMLMWFPLQEFKSNFDPNNHNGGVLLGLNGLVVKSHGGANAKGLASAIGVAAEMAADDLCGLIARDMKKTHAGREEKANAI